MLGYWGGRKGVVHLNGWQGNPDLHIPSNDEWDIMVLRRTADGKATISRNGKLIQKNVVGGQRFDALYLNAGPGHCCNETSDAQLAEISFWNRNITEAEVIALETYLATRWGLRSELPFDHPAYAPPPPNAEAPISGFPVGGLQLWLDAAKLAGKDGQKINKWDSATFDNKYNLVNTVRENDSHPTVKDKVLNGLPVLEFTTANNMELNQRLRSKDYTLAFVTRQLGKANGRFLIGDGNKCYGYHGGRKNITLVENWIAFGNDPNRPPQPFESDSDWDIYVCRKSSVPNMLVKNVKFVRIAGGGDYLQIGQVVVYDSKGANISKGRKATSKDIYGEHTKPEKAVNGNETVGVGEHNCYISRGGQGEWTVELDAPSEVSRVRIYNRAEAAGRLGSGYKVFYLGADGAVLYTSANLNGDGEQVVPNGIVHQFSRNGVLMGLTDNNHIFDNLFINKGGCCGHEKSDGQIAEILMWNIGLNDTDHNTVVGYLANKWGMQTEIDEKIPGYKVPPANAEAPVSGFPTNGIKAWFNASSLKGLVNKRLSKWESSTIDKKYSLVNPSEIEMELPIVLDKALNKLPVVSVTPASFLLLNGSLKSQAYTLASVVRHTGKSNGRIISGNNNRLLGHWGGRKGIVHLDGWAGTHETFLPANDEWDLMIITRTPEGKTTIRRNGKIMQKDVSGGHKFDGLNINRPHEPSDAQIAEIIMYNRAIDDKDVNSIETYLNKA
jgi:hypothetical protein